jgi:hypothetical protein
MRAFAFGQTVETRLHLSRTCNTSIPNRPENYARTMGHVNGVGTFVSRQLTSPNTIQEKKSKLA